MIVSILCFQSEVESRLETKKKKKKMKELIKAFCFCVQ